MAYLEPNRDTLRFRKKYRAHPEIAFYVEAVERGVIQAFTTGLGTTEDPEVVQLKGYDPDPANASGFNADPTGVLWTGLCLALRQTMVEVVEHRIDYEDRDQSLISVGGGARAKTIRRVDVKWPEAWDAALKRHATEDYFADAITFRVS